MVGVDASSLVAVGLVWGSAAARCPDDDVIGRPVVMTTVVVVGFATVIVFLVLKCLQVKMWVWRFVERPFTRLCRSATSSNADATRSWNTWLYWPTVVASLRDVKYVKTNVLYSEHVTPSRDFTLRRHVTYKRINSFYAQVLIFVIKLNKKFVCNFQKVSKNAERTISIFVCMVWRCRVLDLVQYLC